MYWCWDPTTDRVWEVEDVHAWAEWRQKYDRRVARYEYEDQILVSTVFLGILHWNDTLFETMAWFEGHEVYQWRFKTAAEARAFHTRLTDKTILCRLVAGENAYELMEE